MLLKLYKQAKVSEEQEVRWSHVYRLFPAEAGKNSYRGLYLANNSTVQSKEPIYLLEWRLYFPGKQMQCQR